MSHTSFNKIRSVLLLAFTLGFTSLGQASILVIDDFTDFQQVVDAGNPITATSAGPLALTGSDLAGIQRTITSTATGGGFGSQEITIGEPGGVGTGGVLAISNNTFSAGSASLFWSGFTTTDFSAFANAILLDVLAIDLNVSVEMIVNGTSTSGFQAFAGPGNFFVDFVNFSDPSVFAAVNSLQLNFTGPQAWDGQFRLLAVQNNTTVPEPASLALLGLAFIGFGVLRRKRV
ncbi:MAG: hypothetical protein CVV13_08865 [Gammaproteobacteria bacterium HGW-Gammaproteobacteria-3]|nr:MAG: hypothetical protein CVV13_08865 [Gammaproteobacteria bacterium HGW-Gammaproteobacteria-3]